MRRFLDFLYGAAGLLAAWQPSACCLGAGRHHRAPAQLEHPRHGRLCLALASTFKHGEHIRVTLISMAVGTVLFLVALLDELVRRSRGIATSQQTHE